MKTKAKISLLLGLIMVLALAACGGGQGDSAEDENTAVTQVVQTAMAAITQTAAVESPTPDHTATFTPAPTNTATPTATSGPTATLPPIPTNTSVFQQPSSETSTCDIGGFVRDVTIKDGTNFSVGTPFTKTWEIENIGTCTWNKNYLVAFYGGELMAEDNAYTFTTEDIEPGERVQISIEMTAPGTPGNYISYWILKNDVGQTFFVDGSSVYVDISVGITPTPTRTPVPNDPPEIKINAPANGDVFTTDDLINFIGTATDPEDGDISNLIEWKSSRDSFLAQSGNFNIKLTEGIHTITASIEDSEGGTDSVTISLTVNAP